MPSAFGLKSKFGDPDAIHDNVVAEVSALTEKVTPVSADLILIEDSAAGNAKKKAQVGNLPGGGGGGGDTLTWDFSTTTADADPGANTFRANNATPASITFVYLDDAPTSGLTDVGSLMGELGTDDHLYVEDTSGNALLLKLSGAPTDGTGYWKIPVTHQSGGTLPTNADTCFFRFIPTKAGAGGSGGTVQGTDGTYDIQAANEGATAGNARGENSVDLQTMRSSATQVASGIESVIGGGDRNTASNLNSVVSGGFNNGAYASWSGIGSGASNTNSGSSSFLGGGSSNSINSPYAFIGGGSGNVVSGYGYSAVLGGKDNTSSGYYTVVLGGNSNVSSGSYAIAGGYDCFASNSHSFAMGLTCKCTGAYSSATGSRGATTLNNQQVLGGYYTGIDSVPAMVQVTTGMVRAMRTANSTPKTLDIDAADLCGAGVSNNATRGCTMLTFYVSAMDSGGDVAAYKVEGLLHVNSGGNATWAGGSPTTTVVHEADSAWNFTIATDGGPDIRLTFTGDATNETWFTVHILGPSTVMPGNYSVVGS